ncbi:MAG: alkaline phosphatase family protein [bacterium]|nr:alkaline phosphatase family protein [bacterium]
MRPVVACLLALWLVLPALLGCRAPNGPRLVVVVVVDQMRADYMDRFGDQFDGGLKRLAEQGHVFAEAHHAHAPTNTAPGFATLATGRYPAQNGIVDNLWFDRTTGRRVYSTHDASCSALDGGGPCSSPKALRGATVGDLLKRESPDSKIFALALKDRAAAFMAGRESDGALWMDMTTGSITSSTFFLDEIPQWVRDVERSASLARPERWDLARAEEAYERSRVDAFAFEADGTRTTFPHDLVTPINPQAPLPPPFAVSPWGDELTLELAAELVRREELGRDDAPDLLWIGASSADMVGHAFGPRSREVQDYYLRLDRMLGELLAFLDSWVGDDYVVVLTSDHGVCPLPEDNAARRIGPAEFQPLLATMIERVAAERGITGSIPAVAVRESIYLGLPTTAAPETALALRARLAELLRELPYVEDAFTFDELESAGTPPRPFLEAYRNSFDAERSPDVIVRAREHDLLNMRPTTTTHGTPYRYDTHVPLIFHGAGFVAKRDDRPVRTVDVAPTLAHLLGLSPSTDFDGGNLLER